VFAFGISADFRTRLFPGSQRLIELADRVQVLQVEALCWCGRTATHNARTVNGIMVVEGAQVVVGDVATSGKGDGGAGDPGPGKAVVEYETLCRRHYMRRVTAHGADLMAGNGRILPFDVDACVWHESGRQASANNDRRDGTLGS
jgi:thymidine kinase